MVFPISPPKIVSMNTDKIHSPSVLITAVTQDARRRGGLPNQGHGRKKAQEAQKQTSAFGTKSIYLERESSKRPVFLSGSFLRLLCLFVAEDSAA
jgi:hypothetical protein